MSDRSLIILGVVAVLTTVWAILQGTLGGPAVGAAAGETSLIQGIDPGRIHRITIGTGDDAVRLERAGEGRGFVVASKAGYPALAAKINKLITEVLDVEVTEQVTDDPENFEELEVSEEKAGTVVRFYDAEGELLDGLVVGKSVPAGAGSYVRSAAGETVYVCRDVPWLNKSDTDYMETTVLEVELADIARVTVAGPEGEYALVFEGEEPTVSLEGEIPEGKQLKTSDAEWVAKRLNGLAFTDVMSCDAEKAAALKFDHALVCRTEDETVYTLRIAVDDGAYYLMCTAEYVGTLPTRPAETESEEALKAKEAKLLARDAAAEFAARHTPWVYEIASWRAEDLVKTRDELLEDIEKDEEKDDGAAGDDEGEGEGDAAEGAADEAEADDADAPDAGDASEGAADDSEEDAGDAAGATPKG